MNEAMAITSEEVVKITEHDILENEVRTQILEKMHQLYLKLAKRGEDYSVSLFGSTLNYKDGILEITGSVGTLKATDSDYFSITIGSEFKRFGHFPHDFYNYVMKCFLN